MDAVSFVKKIYLKFQKIMQKNLLKVLQTFLIVLAILMQSMAQNNTIIGNVTSVAGEVIPGVSIQIKGTNFGTVTDAKGFYKISVNGEKTVLVISSTGFASQTIIVGNRSTINVVLEEDTKTLDEVIVTALGIKREEKSLGFAAQTINAHAVVDAKSNNWVNTLSGKVAGLNI